jgi:Arc/MetJ-type ribon-helix-helix transcriptional regulator
MPLEQTRITVRLTPEQDTWLATQVKPFATKSDAIRDLIDTARQGLTSVARVPAYCVGAGTQEGFTVPSVQDLQTQQVRQPAACEGQHVSPAPQGIAQPLEPKKNKNKVQRFVFSVPPSLEVVKPELLSFWSEYKAGKKTRAAAALLITGCQDLLDKYGEKVLREQIALACANNWQSITLKGYEQYGLPRRIGGAPAQPEVKHPASREFRGGRFVDEEPPVTNPVTAGMF